MNKGVKLVKGKLTEVSEEIPKIEDIRDVIVKVAYAGICGTDLRVIDGTFPAADEVILGHEFVGIVHEIGSDVYHVKPGDRVAINPSNYCGTCHYCTRGKTQFCIREAMKTCHGFFKDGGWQQYCRVTGHLVYLIPDHMDIRNGILCQPVSDILRGWENMGKVEADSHILIGGAGLIGLLWASIFHYHGYRNVSISEPKERRKKTAEALGLNYRVINPEELNKQKADSVARGDETWGFDVIVDCTGKTKAVETQFQWLRKGSTMVLFGCCPAGALCPLEPYQIYSKEIRLVSSYLNRFTFPKTVNVIDGMASKYLDFQSLGIEYLKLSDYESGIAKMRSGEVGKIVFEI